MGSRMTIIATKRTRAWASPPFLSASRVEACDGRRESDFIQGMAFVGVASYLDIANEAKINLFT